jgi:hypothetical protein
MKENGIILTKHVAFINLMSQISIYNASEEI